MKYKQAVLFCTAILISNFPVQAQSWGSGKGTLSDENKEEIKWDKTTFDLGGVEFGSATRVEYKLTNTSGKPILITNAVASCGCTDIEYPRRPIAPDETVTVSVVFEADDPGIFNKTVILTMNIQKSRQVLKIKGTVKG